MGNDYVGPLVGIVGLGVVAGVSLKVLDNTMRMMPQNRSRRVTRRKRTAQKRKGKR